MPSRSSKNARLSSNFGVNSSTCPMWATSPRTVIHSIESVRMREAPPFRTKADIVYEALRERILSGELRPNERVTISHVARDLGVSDIPAREGVKRLQADGLLDFATHKGAVVASMDADDVEELLAIRSRVADAAVRRGARTIM